ncbi:MAG TPA: D-alanyl-D-alanine carboxypeptidase/D-alanyl-D-alanine-endopeptidase [Pyrinomonadaceae bacterium]|jgi:D-alanyl-D-alanine carboxypeptidase/D-alanyl-D-alanine-endopeptidase (penicillin-binding protein 4)
MPKTILSLVLLFALIAAALPLAAQQQPQRERRVAQPVNAQPTPTPRPSPAESPVSVETPEDVPQSSPTPEALRTTATTRTLAELQARIDQVLKKTELEPAMVGIKVISLDSGRVVFESNANKLLRPASNMKLYTIAAALDRLSPDYRFVTSVYATARPDAAGVVHGDLTIYGRGDPSFAARFNAGNYFKGIDDLAARIVAAGVKRVEGDLIGDETYFVGPQYGAGWEWEDLQWWYGAEVSALTVNDNALDLSIKPGSQLGAPAVVTTGPPDALLTIVNKVLTGARNTRRDITIYRALGADELEIRGSIPLDDRGYSGGIGISRPALLFCYLLRASLAQRGVTFSGKTRTVGPVLLASAKPEVDSTGLIEITNLQSPPLSLIAANTLKPSQNLYTELVLRTLGKVSAPPATAANPNRTSEQAGLEAVKLFLREAGITPSTLVLTDGSGLSRNDMITAAATVQLLTYMHRHRYAAAFRDALPIAGIDGTLRNRFKGTPAENNLRAKTGTLSSATSLSGYVRDAAGEQLAFSIMVNNFPEGADVRASCIDPIALLLTAFAGKTEGN